MMNLSKRDMAMLSYLRQDARISLTALSKKTGIPISTAYGKLKSFRASKLIQLKALVDMTQLGYSTRILVALKVDRESRRETEEYLVKHLLVNNVWRINSGFSYMIEAIFKDMADVEDFLEDLDSRFKVRMEMVFYVISEVQREYSLSRPETVIPLL